MRLLIALATLALAQPAPTPPPAPPAGPHQPEMIPMAEVEVVGKPAPLFKLPMKDGGEFDLAAHKGRVVVVSFWASWCGPCRNEMPEMSKTAQARSDVDWIAVNVDRQSTPALRFLDDVTKKVGPIGLPIAWDSEGQALGDYAVASMPTTFVIDRKGNVAYRKVGYSTEKKLGELMAAVDQALGKK